MKKIVFKIFSILLAISLVMPFGIYLSAHQNILYIDSDKCVVEGIGENGDDEMWYSLTRLNDKKNTDANDDVYYQLHLDQSVTTIKYYFEPFAEDGSGYTWTTEVSEETANEIKQAFADSIKKWNNVYYYSYDENGSVTAYRVINVVEGTAEDHQISIFPIDYFIEEDNDDNIDYIAAVTRDGQLEENDTVEGIDYHWHATHFKMYVNINFFYEHDEIIHPTDSRRNVGKVDADTVYHAMNGSGAHEFGHVLGLSDVDIYCDSGANVEHHEELLMGYGGVSERINRPTYKDIAGVSITRGFHKGDDHLWMLRENRNPVTGEIDSRDVICALCNGVIYNIDLSWDEYADLNLNEYVYKTCVHHEGTNEEMILVATDCVRDFYKCRYCRHIEEVSHEHRYTQWKKYNNSFHIEQCVCGTTGTRTSLHATRQADVVGNTAPCLACGCIVRIDPLGPPTQIIKTVQKISLNGSYILPNGIIVLVDEDVEAYLDGTLVFYDKDKVPEAQ